MWEIFGPKTYALRGSTSKLKYQRISDLRKLRPSDACAQVASLEFMAPAAAKRVDADMLSKLLFQQAIRSTPLSIEEIACASNAVSIGMQG